MCCGRIMRRGFFAPAFRYPFRFSRSSRPLGFFPTVGNVLVICFALRSFPRAWLATFAPLHVSCFWNPPLLPTCRCLPGSRCPANVLTAVDRGIAPSRAIFESDQLQTKQARLLGFNHKRAELARLKSESRESILPWASTSSLGLLELHRFLFPVQKCNRSQLNGVPRAAGTTSGSHPLMGFFDD